MENHNHMRRNKHRQHLNPQKLDARSKADAERALERMLMDFWEVHQTLITKMQRCETPSPEEIAEATLTQRLLTEQRQRKREESAKAARQLLDAIDLEP
jgi:hypothetical protein